MTLAFPHADQGWLAFFALVPFFTAFPFKSNSGAFWSGFLLGFAYFGGLLYWIAVFAATKIGGFGIACWFILSARESLWVGVFAAILNLVWRRTDWPWRIVAAASLWTICEWIRQLGTLGFGWGDLAYSQWRALPLIQIASITGIWGVSWLIVLVNAALASGKYRVIRGTAIVLLGAAIFGYARIALIKPPHELTAADLQSNISEDVPYDGLRPADSRYFFGTLRDFDSMAAAARKNQGASICVTAETSIPGYPTLDPGLKLILTNMARQRGITYIVGARSTDVASQEDTNSVFAFRPDGSMSGPYNKQQLVPFGEYVPGRKEFPFLNAFHVLDFDMAAGPPDQPPLQLGNGQRAGIAICYESTYPRFLREQVMHGATFDVVVTDDTWYGRTAAAAQHMDMSVLRAVETDRSLVRCASTGISAIIDPDGHIQSSAPIFVKATVSGQISNRHNITPFVLYGDWWVAVCALLALLAGTIFGKAKEPAEQTS